MQPLSSVSICSFGGFEASSPSVECLQILLGTGNRGGGKALCVAAHFACVTKTEGARSVLLPDYAVTVTECPAANILDNKFSLSKYKTPKQIRTFIKTTI